MKDLIESLQIMYKYTGDMDYPTHCEHDIMYAANGTKVHPDNISAEDRARLEELGWFWKDEFDCWASYKFGSA